jgi:catalase
MAPSNGGLVEEVIDPAEAALTSAFISFLESASRRRHPTGPVQRFNQGRAAGCVEAEFIVPADLPPALRVGLFAAPGSYRAFIRFANASSATDREKDVRGMSIAVADVPGENLTPGATSQEFVLNSHPVMVAPDAKEFLAFLEANEAGGLRRVVYFATHPALARIGLAARQNPSCHLDIPYWSATPYLFGTGRAVKYIVRPRSGRTSATPANLTDDYLGEAFRKHLNEAEAAFDFAVQFQTDPERMPIEDATVEWKEQESPFVPVARIRIPRQQLAASGTGSCEAAAFNPWHALVEHRPLGSLNRARRAIYPALSAFRRAHA